MHTAQEDGRRKSLCPRRQHFRRNSAIDPNSARILLTGTLAIDYAGGYPGVFSTLPRHRGINLSVQLDRIGRRFGGCAMNIAYTLKLLGHEPAPFVFVGRDFDGDYAAHLDAAGMDVSGVQVAAAPYSSHAFICTDREQNQFTGFFGGPAEAADFAPRLRRFVQDRPAGSAFDYAVLAPDAPANMIVAAKVARQHGIPFLADPGQNLTDFAAEDAATLVQLSDALIVNEFEHETLGGFVGDALDRLDLLLVTEGERGTFWRSKSEGDGRERAAEAAVVDSTGCGDAFRAGFVHARLRGANLRDAVRAGGVTAAIVLEAEGTQTHGCDDFALRYRQAWDDAPAWLRKKA